jgi:hypothetical protein
MRENPERLAWTILLTAFAIFCFLATGIPLGIYHYVSTASVAHTTAITSVRGTVIVEQLTSKRGAIPITDGNTVEVDEDSYVETSETSQAILAFFEDSTVTMYNNTRVRLEKARSPRFEFSSLPPTIILSVQKGRIRVSPSVHSPLHFEVRSPQTTAWLQEGSYAIEVGEDMTQITARSGQVRVNAADETITIKQGERILVEEGKKPSGPLSAAQNLVVNGAFTEPLSDTWELYTFAPESNVAPQGAITTYGDRNVVEFKSSGRDNIHNEAGIKQIIGKDVRDFRSLYVHLNVRLVNQSLPGGGTLGTEYPVMVHVNYKDRYGNDQDWYHGFYYEPTLDNWLLTNGERIARSVWYPYESRNLLVSLEENKPVSINYIRIYASGWIYNSMVTDVALLAQE